ncbi:1-acyl-sn-glycerol-3-phosphate acyltransferase, putative [alpha proteobacterium BAL199]|jgi:1-acyl-sn-glycerol-3-phosphate acyltransferase|nr:1-acyl-sn-glycerol-3-phosphate acyltransferase, putative [alpha proteobacterium BAL199]
MFRTVLPSLLFYAQAAGHTGYAAFKAGRGRLDNPGLVRGSHALRRALESVGVRFEISGLDAIDCQSGPYVFVANHMSALETQILPSILQDAAPCTFVVKSSLLRYPVFGSVLRAFDPIVVNRADPRADLRVVLDEGLMRLRAGTSVIIFPQAHRTATFSRKTFNSIGMRLARSACVPMVPIALDTAAWSQGRWLKDIGWITPERPVRFAVGRPIEVGAEGPAAHQETVAFIERTIAGWGLMPPVDLGSAEVRDDGLHGEAIAISAGAGQATPAS